MTKEPKQCPHCGFYLHKPRSLKAHRLFFAILDLAFENWPETHPFQPYDSEHLRAWLLCKVGYGHVIGDTLMHAPGDQIRVTDLFIKALEAMRTRKIRYVFPVVDGNAVLMVMPKSINWGELDERGFAPIREKVFAFIESTTYLKVKDLQRHARENA